MLRPEGFARIKEFKESESDRGTSLPLTTSLAEETDVVLVPKGSLFLPFPDE